MKQYIDVDCGDCKLCCRFSYLSGQWLTLNEAEVEFGFNTELCDTYFLKKDDYYFVDEFCIQYKNNKCSIHEKPQLPITCGLYPFFIVEDNKKRQYLAIDKNCPCWKKLVLKEIINIISAKAVELQKCYSAMGREKIYTMKTLKMFGYRIKKIKQIDFVS